MFPHLQSTAPRCVMDLLKCGKGVFVVRIRVLLIEDNCLMREGAIKLLNLQADIKAAWVSSGNGCVSEKAESFKPHVALVNVDATHEDGSVAIRKIQLAAPRAAIILTNLTSECVGMMDFIRDDVSGFIPREATVEDWLSTIRAVADGRKVLPADLSAALFSQIAKDSARSGVAGLPAGEARMTRREGEVMELVARGRSNKEIATELCLSVHTVKSHVHNILEKMALTSRLELAHRVLTSHRRVDRAVAIPFPGDYLNL